MGIDYSDSNWLTDELVKVLEFYYPTCTETEYDGFCAQLDEETGEVYDAASRHLVASSRFVVNFSLGHQYDGPDWCQSMVSRGVDFLHDAHRDPETGGYDWLLEGTDPVDQTRICYGHAFVLLAYARAFEAGIDKAETHLTEVSDLLLERFWEPEYHLFKSEYSADWGREDEYRGQNANMHACEAMLATYEATDKQRYLDYAHRIARTLCVDLATTTDGLLWEHYTEDWTHDMDYNRNTPADQFRPWGYQPGHHSEWAKLLAILNRHTTTDWALPRAEELFTAAVEYGWDEEYGGFYYTFSPDGDPIVSDKYGWPVAEAIGAAAALHERTGRDRYRTWYDRLWTYAKRILVAPGRNWYQKCTRENTPYETEVGPEVEPGYHPIGACAEALRSFNCKSEF